MLPARAPRLEPTMPAPCAAGLRSHAAQRLLSELARLPRVHLAASVDHVNAALLWDQQVGRGRGGPAPLAEPWAGCVEKGPA